MKNRFFVFLAALLSLGCAFTLALHAQTISGNNPIVIGPSSSWPLANHFDGTGPTVDLGNSAALNTQKFTISAWAKFDGLSHPPGTNGDRPAGDMSIVDKMTTNEAINENIDGWRLIKQDDNHFWFCLGAGNDNGCGSDPTPPTTIRSTTEAQVGRWYNVVAVLGSPSTSQPPRISLYVNGVLEDSKPLPTYTDTHTTSMRIGSSSAGGGYAYFNGVIDEVTFYRAALSGSAINAYCTALNGGISCH